MTDLDRLIEAVEAGNDWISPPADRAFTDKQHAVWACKAFGHEGQPGTSGSLDAARALHEALIHSCQANIELSGEVWVLGDETDWKYVEAKVYGNPARAWLIAILRAYRAKIGGDG